MSPFYPWFHYLHVAAAFWLAAGIFASAVVRAQGRRAAAAEPAAAKLAADLLWRLHVIFTLPGVVVAGFIGFYLVTSGGFRFGDTWVLAASFLYLAMFLSTLFAVTPGLARQRHAPSPTIPKLAGIASDVNALILLVLAWLMVVKP